MDRPRALHLGRVFHFQTLVAVLDNTGCGGARRNAAQRARENPRPSTSSLRRGLDGGLVRLQFRQRSYYWRDPALRPNRTFSRSIHQEPPWTYSSFLNREPGGFSGWLQSDCPRRALPDRRGRRNVFRNDVADNLFVPRPSVPPRVATRSGRGSFA